MRTVLSHPVSFHYVLKIASLYNGHIVIECFNREKSILMDSVAMFLTQLRYAFIKNCIPSHDKCGRLVQALILYLDLVTSIYVRTAHLINRLRSSSLQRQFLLLEPKHPCKPPQNPTFTFSDLWMVTVLVESLRSAFGLTFYGAWDGNRTRTRENPHGILSPMRLPIPPPRHGIILF